MRGVHGGIRGGARGGRPPVTAGRRGTGGGACRHFGVTSGNAADDDRLAGRLDDYAACTAGRDGFAASTSGWDGYAASAAGWGDDAARRDGYAASTAGRYDYADRLGDRPAARWNDCAACTGGAA